MLYRNDGCLLFEKRGLWLRSLIYSTGVFRALGFTLFLLSFLYFLFFVFRNLGDYLYARDWSKKNGKLVQFFFLGGGDSAKNFLSLFDLENFVKLKGDKIQIQEKIKVQHIITWIYKNLVFLVGFSWIFSVKKELWRAIDRFSTRICSFFGNPLSISKRNFEILFDVFRKKSLVSLV